MYFWLKKDITYGHHPWSQGCSPCIRKALSKNKKINLKARIIKKDPIVACGQLSDVMGYHAISSGAAGERIARQTLQKSQVNSWCLYLTPFFQVN